MLQMTHNLVPMLHTNVASFSAGEIMDLFLSPSKIAHIDISFAYIAPNFALSN